MTETKAAGLNSYKRPMDLTISLKPTHRKVSEGSPGKSSPSNANMNPEDLCITKTSSRFKAKGLTEEKIELKHLRTIVKEMDREIRVMESIRADNKILKEQLVVQDE